MYTHTYAHVYVYMYHACASVCECVYGDAQIGITRNPGFIIFLLISILNV